MTGRADLTCPLCRGGLDEDPAERAVTCAGCATGYHASCAQELGGCATLGCERRGRLPDGVDPLPTAAAPAGADLVARAMDPDVPWGERIAAARRAGAAGLPVLAKLVPETRFTIGGLRRTQRMVVEHADHPLAGDVLTALHRVARWVERRALLDALGAPEQAPLLPAIATIGLEGSPAVQLGAIGAAERVGHPAAAPFLRALEQRGHPYVRAAARRALARIGAGGAPDDALAAAVQRAVEAAPAELPPPRSGWELVASPPRRLGAAIVVKELCGLIPQCGWLVLASWFACMLTIYPQAAILEGFCWFAFTAIAWATGLVDGLQMLRFLRRAVFTRAEVLGVTRATKRYGNSRSGRTTYTFHRYDVRFVVPDGRVLHSRIEFNEEQPSLAKGDEVDVGFDPADSSTRPLRLLGPFVVRSDGALTVMVSDLIVHLIWPTVTLALFGLVLARGRPWS